MKLTKYESDEVFCDTLEASMREYLKEIELNDIYVYSIVTRNYDCDKKHATFTLCLGSVTKQRNVYWKEVDGYYNDGECLEELIRMIDGFSYNFNKDPELKKVKLEAIQDDLKTHASEVLPTGPMINANNAKKLSGPIGLFKRISQAYRAKKDDMYMPIVAKYTKEEVFSFLYGYIRDRANLAQRLAIVMFYEPESFDESIIEKLHSLGYSIIFNKGRMTIIW